MAARHGTSAAEPGPGTGTEFWQPLVLLWDEALGDVAARTRPAPTGLDRTAIVRAAAAIADADGLEAVSMRRIAQDLGAGAMSLYRHVPDKNTLISLMIEHVLTEREDEVDPAAEASTTGRSDPHWRAMMLALAGASWNLVQQHPWYAEASMVRPQLTPRSVAGLEWALSAFDGFDLGPGEAMTMVGAVHSTVIARALTHVIEGRTRRAAGLESEEDVQRAGAELVRRILGTGDYPRLGRFIVEDQADSPPDETWRPVVELICDGIEARLSRQPTPAGGSRTKKTAGAQPKKTSASA